MLNKVARTTMTFPKANESRSDLVRRPATDRVNVLQTQRRMKLIFRPRLGANIRGRAKSILHQKSELNTAVLNIQISKTYY